MRFVNWQGDIRVVTATLTLTAPAAGLSLLQAAAAITTTSETIEPGPLPIQRHPEISPESLVLVSVDGAGRLLSWQPVPDPRVVRAEFADASGALHGTTLVNTTSSLQFAIPDDPAIRAINVYAVEWTAGGPTLVPIGVWTR